MIPQGREFYLELNRIAHAKFKRGEITATEYGRQYRINGLNFARVMGKELHQWTLKSSNGPN